MLFWRGCFVVAVVDVMLSCSCQVVGVLLCWCIVFLSIHFARVIVLEV